MAALIKKRNRKHPAQLLNTVGAHLFIEMDDHLRISVGIKRVPPCFEFLAQFGKIVDFTVENHPNAAVFIMDRLPPAREIDDAEPAHAQPDWAFGVDSLIVGTTVNDRLAHSPYFGRIDLLITPPDNAGYPTHRSTSDLSGSEIFVTETGLRPCTAIGCSITCSCSSPQLSNQRNTSS